MPELPEVETVVRGLVSLALVFAVGLGAVSSAAAQDGDYTPIFEESDCFGAGATLSSTTCGYLVVPEDRADPHGRQVRLAVMIHHAQTDAARPDPIVYLSGGPGGSAVSVPSSLFGVLRAERDLILIDQRGTGLSHPNLDCPEVALDDVMEARLTQSTDAAYALYSAGLTACRDRLVAEGVNLAAYSSAASAADIADLRVALGLESWNLFGVSYGTRVAQTVMRDHPEGVRSVVLDSVLPVEINFTADRTSRTFEAVATLVAGCAADAACQQAFPDLEENLFSLVSQLEEEPIPLRVKKPGETGGVTIQYDGLMVYEMLYSMLYTAEIIPALPQLIATMYAGDFKVAAVQASRLFGPNPGLGVYVNVNCAEETNLTTLDAAVANIDLGPALDPLFRQNVQDELVQIFGQCEVWGVRPADPIENDAVTSSLPTLILNGTFDPVTPPAYAQMVHDHLPNSFYIEFPALGHTAVFSSPCAGEVTVAFLNDPATAPYHACLDELGPPEFIVSPGPPQE